MSAIELRPRRRRRPAVNITSLIDVLFLLLIFIMVSSTFVEHPAIELTLPTATTAEAAAIESITLSLTAAGVLYLDGVELAVDEIRPRLAEAVAENPELTVNLRADESVDYGLVMRAIDAARQAEVRHVSAFTEASAGEQAPD